MRSQKGTFIFHPMIKVVDGYGRGGRAPNIWAGGTLSQVPLPHYSRSQLKSSCLYLLISWYFISPKCTFYFNADKEAGDFRPPDPCYAPICLTGNYDLFANFFHKRD